MYLKSRGHVYKKGSISNFVFLATCAKKCTSFKLESQSSQISWVKVGKVSAI